LEDIISTSSKLLLVEFYTQNSTRSYLLELSLRDIVVKYSSKIDVYKIDIEKNPKLFETYNLFPYPSLLIFSKGVLIDTLTGAISKSFILSKVNNHIGDIPKTV